MPAASTTTSEERDFVVDGQQERPWPCRIGDHEDFQESDNVDGPTVRCKQEKKPRCMSKNWTYSWRLCFLKKHPPFFHSESSAKIMCFYHWTSGQKPHLTKKWQKIQIAISRTTYHSLSLVCRRVPLLHLHLILEQYGRGPWRIGGDGRIGTPRQKAQCQGSVNAAKKWKLHLPNRRWNSQNFWKRSGSENIHTNPGQPKKQKRSTRKSSRKIRRVFFNFTTRIIMVWWWSPKWFLVSLKRFHLPSSRGTPSQTVRAEKNFPEMHWRSQNH